MSREILIILCYFITIVAGNFFVKWICGFLNFELAKDSGIKKAGMIIGFLERFLVLTFVLLDRYLAIGFLFTAKSIARFEELKNRDFAEYYLIGTLSSISFAVFCGLVLRSVLE